MREACIICPTYGNEGNSLEYPLDLLRQVIVKKHGGLTEIEGNGQWLDATGKLYSEPVHIFTIAMEHTSDNMQWLRDTAQWLRQAARQKCVYIRQPNGAVEFIDN